MKLCATTLCCHGYMPSLLALGRVMHVVYIDQMAVQVAAVLHLQREVPVTEDAHVTLELRRRWDLICGRLGVVGHLSRPSAVSVETRVIAALGSAVTDVASTFVAAVDALIVLRISGFVSLTWKHQRRR